MTTTPIAVSAQREVRPGGPHARRRQSPAELLWGFDAEGDIGEGTDPRLGHELGVALPIHPMTHPMTDGLQAGRTVHSPSAELTVVVCSFNGAHRIAPCLEALINQIIPVRVIVVDDGSTDDLIDVVARYPVEYVSYRENRGLSAARNHGLSAAATQWVAFCDDDCSPPSDWTRQVLASWHAAGGDVVAIGGTVSVADTDSVTQRYLTRNNPLAPLEFELASSPNLAYRLSRQLVPGRERRVVSGPVYSMVGANMTVDREKSLTIGGFDVAFRAAGDDLYLSAALRDTYGPSSVVVDSTITMGHRFEPEFSHTLRRSRSYGRGAGERWVASGGWPSLRVTAALAIAVTVATTGILAAAALLGTDLLTSGSPAAIVLGVAACLGAGVVTGIVAGVAPRYPWFIEGLGRRRREVLAYPFLALLEDLVHTAALVGAALRSGAQRRRSVHMANAR